MNELDCQQLLIDAVKEVGGQGVKLNNKFVIGVVDELLQYPGYGAMMLEAKLHRFSAKTLAQGHVIQDIGCTKLQKDYLRDWGAAGMLTGVASFVMEQGSDVRSLRLALYSYEFMVGRSWSANVIAHRPLGEKSERLTNIRQQLMEFASG